MLALKNIVKSFNKTQPVLSNVSLMLKESEIVSLLGDSGCGKTTLMRIIAGFEFPDRGSIQIGDKILVDKNIFIPPEKRNVGIVFQQNTLFPHLSVAKNICFAISKKSNTEQHEKLEEMINLFALKGTERQFPHQLSGGQQRRVDIARTLISSPSILLLDEPFVNLDEHLKYDLIHEIKTILKSKGVTTLFVTHDMNDAIFMGDEIAVMDQGIIIQKGSSQSLYKQPNYLRVAELFGTLNLVSHENGNTVYIRAEDVELDSENGELSGVVVEIIPIGKFNRIVLEIAPNKKWWLKSELPVEIGQRVGLLINREKLITFH